MDTNIHQSDQSKDQIVYLSATEAVDYIRSKGLRITVGQLANLRHFGRGPSYSKFNSYIYYTIKDLDMWLASAIKRETTHNHQLS